MQYMISDLPLFRVLFVGGGILVAGATRLGGAGASGVEVRSFPALDGKIYPAQLSFDLPRSLLGRLGFTRRPPTAHCSVALVLLVLSNGVSPLSADPVVRSVD
jgi:hypothetical protein